MNRFTKVAAAACALAFSATSAFAASSASASISNLQFQVIDLMPADSVTNFYATNSLGVSMSVSALDGSAGTNENHTYNRNSGLFTFSKTTSVDADTAQGQAAVNAKGMSVSGSSTGPQTSFSGSIQSNGSSGWPYYSGSLTLSAHSVLIVTADALVKASATNPSACEASYYCNSTEQANASAFMNLNYSVQGQAGSTSGSSSNSLSLSASARADYSYQNHVGYDWSQPDWYNHPIYEIITVPKSEQTFEQAANFYAVFTNTSNVDQLANFTIGVSVSGNASTGLLRSAGGLSAVPEADSLALAMVGLMTAGTMLRRRRHG